MFNEAVERGVGLSLISRYALISPQAANFTRNRLAEMPPDDDAPSTVDDVLNRMDVEPTNDSDSG